MKVNRPHCLKIGDRVRFDGLTQTVTGVSGTLVRLTAENGKTSAVHLPHLQSSEGFQRIGEADRPPVLAAGALDGFAPEVVAEAEWWHRHIAEVATGLPPGVPAGTRPRPEYDPAVRSLAEREQAKAEELAGQRSEGVSVGTVKRKRQRFEAQGVAGLIDRRVDRTRSVQGRTDPRVLAALQKAVNDATHRSTRTGSYFFWQVEQLLTAEYGRDAVAMPSRATFYRLFERATNGRHTTGSARTRRSLANQPDTPFGEFIASRPGELMEIDSTPFDVMVLLDKGVPGRVELTGMVDLATRTLTAAVLRPTTRSVDASLLLARTVTPEQMRPGWSEALSMKRSVLPHRRLLELDQRLEHAAAKPIMIPEAIICDHGKVFISHNFRMSCHSLGINFEPAHLDTPTGKPHIERTLGSISTLFCQFVSGYVGRSAEHRGRKVEDEPMWSLMELQDLLDEWVVAMWQNRPHDGLRDPVTPGRTFTPNEKYATLVETTGYIPLALSAEDYIELLPAQWKVVNTHGIKINHRVYDAKELAPFRRQPSGVAAKKNLWEVHHDPYDASRIWVRNHWDGGWITVFWRYLKSFPVPFGETAWDHARQTLSIHGKTPTELEIAGEVNALLQRAHQGPATSERPKRKASRRDQRIAARTRATAEPAWPRPEAAPMPAGESLADEHEPDGDLEDAEESSIAAVVPLRVFDAREEAKKWR